MSLELDPEPVSILDLKEVGQVFKDLLDYLASQRPT